MSVSITYDYDPTEHYRALRATTRRTFWWWFLPLILLVPAALAILTLIDAHTRQTDATTTLIAVAPYIFLLIFWIALIPYAQRRRAKRLPSIDASVLGPQIRRIDANGYHSEGNGVVLDVPWHAFVKCVETEDFFPVLFQPTVRVLLPEAEPLAGDTCRGAKVRPRRTE